MIPEHLSYLYRHLQGSDPVRDKPRRSGKDSADGVAVLAFASQCGVCCCSMYWRTMEIGAPPQLEAK